MHMSLKSALLTSTLSGMRRSTFCWDSKTQQYASVSTHAVTDTTTSPRRFDRAHLLLQIRVVVLDPELDHPPSALQPFDVLMDRVDDLCRCAVPP